ncbi:pilus assembly protein TadG-related protein [Nocardiopsis sp. RSe5-2]|uniref:Pilus assembly protein TadG-related protein n=1 Tax=Nocardiopsis endophytica TaxID=3018445 RepID=A0ABT4U2G4_9ACTN|nr:pilus assembly protein TadG-related protein [Nocardiopsis endophytica]MDA2811143.1 pilus assembly protein TadG-related protein [Nocardiopsis endophytica]
MKLILTSRFTGERGQASLYLLVGLALSLAALAVLFVRVGEANNMRSSAQTAADAAALAAAGDIQHRVAETLAGGNLPWGVGWQAGSGKSAAKDYAAKNNATLEDIRASDNEQGRIGNFVRVEVRGNACQRELQDDRSVTWMFRECPDKEELEEAEKNDETIPVTTGNAAAIAEVQIPDCQLVPLFNVLGVEIGNFVACRPADSGGGYQRIWTYGQAKGMTDVRLVDREGQWIYSELTGGPGSGRYPCDAVGGQNITRQMCETHEAIMGEWGAVFEKYGVGCYRSQEDGGDHPRGRACDYMVSANGNLPSADLKQGSDAAAQWMIDNHEKLDISYIMWDHHIWNPSRDPVGDWNNVKRWVPERGGNTVNHMDHIHVSVNT